VLRHLHAARKGASITKNGQLEDILCNKLCCKHGDSLQQQVPSQTI
jgi:hypothetical protein